jgi:peptidoglycan/xylan/chitin deacetylase (PgdA/CDA1 family)
MWKSNRRLLAGLKRHRIPATGFVNEYKIDDLGPARQTAILRAWLDAGMDLGNHTFSHDSPNAVGAKAYVEDIAKGEAVTSPAGRAAARKLVSPARSGNRRHAGRQGADRRLAGRPRLPHRPVTLNATDWRFAEPYDDAVAHHDGPRAARIRAAYLAYTREMIGWYRKGAHALFGRDIAYVLLHDTRLNADSIDALARLLRQARLKPVSLAQAMRDPAYRTPDAYAAKEGIDWMERFALSMKKDLPWDSFHDVPKWVQAEYDKVDTDREATP